MKQFGFEVMGTELNAGSAKKARKVLGKAKILKKGWEEKLAKKKFDIISLWHVLEHLDFPVQLLRDLRKFLKLNGLLVIAVPNWQSIAHQMSKSNYYDIGIPAHLNFWNTQTLIKALNKTGFAIKSIKYPFQFVLRLSRSLQQLLISKNIRFGLPTIAFYLNVPISLVISMIGFYGIGEVLIIFSCPQKEK